MFWLGNGYMATRMALTFLSSLSLCLDWYRDSCGAMGDYTFGILYFQVQSNYKYLVPL
jgi:hypothetical protein